MPITTERVLELIKQHDENPNPKLGGWNYMTTKYKMALENDGVDWETWDGYKYTDKDRSESLDRIDLIIEKALGVKKGSKTKTEAEVKAEAKRKAEFDKWFDKWYQGTLDYQATQYWKWVEERDAPWWKVW